MIVDRFAEVFGAGPAQTLRASMASRNLAVSVAEPEWTAQGFTASRLIAVTVQRAAGEPRKPLKCILKYCPPGPYAQESARHHEALDRSPDRFARRHLVAVVLPSVVGPDGSVLLFQDIAGGSLLTSTLLSGLDGAALADTCRFVAQALTREWTGPGYGVAAVTSVPALLRLEIRDAAGPDGWLRQWATGRGLLEPSAVWIVTPEDGVLPNPLYMIADDAPAGARRTQYVTGRSHGDLHGDNILVPVAADDTPSPDRFRLLDLTTFEFDAPLSRDPATLTLALVAHRVGHMPAEQQQALIDYLVTADRSALSRIPPYLVQTIDALRRANGAPFLSQGYADEWNLQYLVSLQAAALLHSTYDSVGAAGRWWCLRLAANLAGRLTPRPWPVPPTPRAVDPDLWAGLDLSGPQTSQRRPPMRTVDVRPAAPAPMSLAERGKLVDALVGVAALRDPDTRQRIYDELPTDVIQHVHRNSAVRHEMFDLVHAFESFAEARPWSAFVAVLDQRLPGAASVARLRAVLRDLRRIDDAGG